MLKKILTLILVIICIVPLFAQGGTEVSVKKTSDLRIVSLAPNVTEMIYALGSGDNLVGRTDYCNYPEEAKNVQSIGTLWDPNMETILALDADVAIASSIVDPSFIDSLNKAGIKAYQFYEENSYEGTYTLIEKVADVIGKQAEGQKIIQDMKARAEEIRKITSMVNMRRSAVFIIGYGDWGDYAATGDTFLDGVIEAAGGVNAAKSGIAWSISKELLLEKDPDVILLSGNQGSDPQTEIATFTSLEPYSRLSACKNKKVYVIDGDAAQRQGVRTIETVEEIAKLLYPGLFI
ncbi:MAG: ABC transporter substrate-binding protein [Spirochaetales bacterium]|nr:ABC transporter substrate-binding protein [Spirochaetales bacterium]MBO6049501.1 ABC transporter substrate-binding protein [Spirochaetales bacterium]